MPKVTIWIRVSDEAKWKAIENKPEWLREHLNTPGPMPVFAMEDIKKGQYGAGYVGRPKPVSQIIDETNQAVVESLGDSEVIKARLYSSTTKSTGVLTEAYLEKQFNKAEKASNLCEHYQPKGQCNVKNCKYGRGSK